MQEFVEALLGVASQDTLILLTSVCMVLTLVFFIAWRRWVLPSFLYAHLTVLFLPLLVFAVSLNCTLPFATSLLSLCTLVLTQVIILLIPTAALTAIIFGYALMPVWIRWHYSAKPISLSTLVKPANRAKSRDGIKGFILDTGAPLAFAARNAVFISVGMIELLTPKETEAVVLHEIGHIKRGSSWAKFSIAVGRYLSPLVRYWAPSLIDEEAAADEYSAQIQGTWKHITTARRKVEEF